MLKQKLSKTQECIAGKNDCPPKIATNMTSRNGKKYGKQKWPQTWQADIHGKMSKGKKIL